MTTRPKPPQRPIFNPPNFRCRIEPRDWSALHAPITGGVSIEQVIARLDAAGSGIAIDAAATQYPKE